MGELIAFPGKLPASPCIETAKLAPRKNPCEGCPYKASLVKFLDLSVEIIRSLPQKEIK